MPCKKKIIMVGFILFQYGEAKSFEMTVLEKTVCGSQFP
jgi:hypothetical protein